VRGIEPILHGLENIARGRALSSRTGFRVTFQFAIVAAIGISGRRYCAMDRYFIGKLFFAVVVAASISGAGAVRAAWDEKVYTSEYNDCVGACTNKNKTTKPALCEGYCKCALSDYQAQFPDHEKLVADAAQGVSTTVNRLQTIGNTCNQKFWGRPADKLNFDNLRPAK
jgi:hypothetical protein